MTFPGIGKRLLFVFPAIPIAWWIVNSTFAITLPGAKPIFPGHLLTIALTLFACWEYIGMLKLIYPENGFWISFIWLGLQFVLYITDNQLPHYLSYYVLMLLVAIEAFAWGRKHRTRRWLRASLLFSGVAILYMCSVSLLNFYSPPFQLLFRQFGPAMLSQLGICMIILAVALCDSFAYFVGCSFGKHHFSVISPNKTIEGAIGGFVAALVTASVGWLFLGHQTLPKGLGILLGVLIGIFAQLGDLLVSLMKRYFNVKDSSQLIPGHGGILDRFGSLFFTAPAISMFCWIVTRVYHL